MFSGNTSQVSDGKLYVEDVFSTWLHTGTAAAQTITNGIDLAGKGGLVWIKARSVATNNFLFDTARGVGVEINSNTTEFSSTLPTSLTAFNSNGFSLGVYNQVNGSPATYASWTFREAPKFFDVVTYTGTGSARTIAHNLGVAPGCILVKRTDTTADWQVYHRGYDGSFNASYYYFALNLTTGYTQNSGRWNNTQPTSTEFTVGTNTNVNASGGTYVAYLFAHDATSDGVIQCGSYTGNGSATGPTISLGWEPQWVMVKNASSSGNWWIFDNMRGVATGGVDEILWANTTNNSDSTLDILDFNATGFQLKSTNGNVNANTNTYIYIAIRRGPMKTPTLGTSVFAPVKGLATNPATLTTSFPVDLSINTQIGVESKYVNDRLRGSTKQSTAYLLTDQVSSETLNTTGGLGLDSNTAIIDASWWNTTNAIYWNFRRAPGFFDEVCYTGTGAARTFNHNLGVVPELMIVKSRLINADWQVYSAALPNTQYLVLNSTAAKATGTDRWDSTSPTSTTFRIGTASGVNFNGSGYVAYLFASCAGVSNVGSYTGNGSSQTINCGFAAGARFVMIKRTDSTGDWYVWDTARGIVAANDPHLSLNTTAAQVTTDDTIDTNSSGFVVNQVAATNVNVSSATYIYLAIA